MINNDKLLQQFMQVDIAEDRTWVRTIYYLIKLSREIILNFPFL